MLLEAAKRKAQKLEDKKNEVKPTPAQRKAAAAEFMKAFQVDTSQMSDAEKEQVRLNALKAAEDIVSAAKKEMKAKEKKKEEAEEALKAQQLASTDVMQAEEGAEEVDTSGMTPAELVEHYKKEYYESKSGFDLNNKMLEGATGNTKEA